ncbi:MFS transporter [uncultured Dokdonia sp.]|uniref:MFS transporter n=1 Tax=uncultured Dokdonia sp. TaxID=575653 RepID=UPI002627377C|nr:MFS transporter [uncultured Dokdonia sp.]
MKLILRNYIKTFEGLSKEVWWLSLITFVNRFGAMVIPFLSIYLNESIGITLSDIAWIMSAYGLGSVVGSYIGGKLTDLIGYYKVILLSLFFTGINFLWVMHIAYFWGLCFSFFILITLADMGRPAFFVALSAYSKPENKTRSLTLLRLAINLGMGAGPMIGGLLIGTVGYHALFYADGFTCLLAALLMMYVLNPKTVKEVDTEVVVENPIAPEKDITYVYFLIGLILFAMAFLPLFTVVPLYYTTVYEISKPNIGLLMGINPIMIVLLEMPLVTWLLKKKYDNIQLTIIGIAFTGLSYIVLVWEAWIGVLFISIVLMTFGEMIGFPFSNKFALDRSKIGKQGAFMGLYSMAFAIASIFSHNAGMQITAKYGFKVVWLFIFGLTVIACFFMYLSRRKVMEETTTKQLYLKSK